MLYRRCLMSIELSKMPKIGFGLMRLPEKDGEIDIEHVKRMVDKYMKMDVNNPRLKSRACKSPY
jgi:predicted aldo/keto reductase-like oxidoreductase